MAFKRGSKKPEGSGRQKGTPNKASLRFVEDLDQAGINIAAEYLKAAKAIEDPEKRVTAIARLFRYCYPRLKEIDPLEFAKALTSAGVEKTSGFDASSPGFIQALLALASVNEPRTAAKPIEPSSGA